jgi:hypothetical protein
VHEDMENVAKCHSQSAILPRPAAVRGVVNVDRIGHPTSAGNGQATGASGWRHSPGVM